MYENIGDVIQIPLVVTRPFCDVCLKLKEQGKRIFRAEVRFCPNHRPNHRSDQFNFSRSLKTRSHWYRGSTQRAAQLDRQRSSRTRRPKREARIRVTSSDASRPSGGETGAPSLLRRPSRPALRRETVIGALSPRMRFRETFHLPSSSLINMAAPTPTTRFSDNYELKEELGK